MAGRVHLAACTEYICSNIDMFMLVYNIDLRGEPVHDGGDGHLTQPLDLGNDSLAVVQLEAVLQPHLLPGPEHGGSLLVTPLLH